MTNTLIIGAGEVGTALAEVLKQYDPHLIDEGEGTDQKYKYMHVCFPYSEDFIQQVKDYQAIYEPTHTVIHSTVPVGTSRECQAVHSPVRGLHPHLAEGIGTFVKLVGGERASDVADHLRRAGIKVCLYGSSEATEAAKLFDTEYYRSCIEFAHRVSRYCDEHGLNFHEVYTIPNQTYNDGYAKLGHPEYVRPVLQAIKGPIGGHCLIPNSKLL